MILSRRGVLIGGAAKVAGLESNEQSGSPLVVTGRRFDQLKTRLDSNDVVDDAFWAEFRSVTDRLVHINARTPQDYFAKARAAAWARLGDLDPPRTATLDTRIALAVLRDIILQHDPRLYQSGALARMYGELERSNSG